LDKKNRLEYIHFIALEYLKYYRKQKNIIAIDLVTAIKMDDGVLQRIRSLIKEKYEAEVEIYEKINPKIIGGFIFEMDSQQLDASVVGELKRIREELLEGV
jgi:F-type H+-transporting ATPase subunit delta